MENSETDAPFPVTLAGRVLGDIHYTCAGRKLADCAPEMAADAKDGAILAVQRAKYKFFAGYLVPHYHLSEDEINRRSEQLVIDRVKRFFYSAEMGIDVPWTGEEIAREKSIYQALQDSEMKAVKARFLVGALVNRMGRLAQAILQKNIDGIDLEIQHASGNYQLDEAQIETLREEFRNDYLFLVADEEHSPVNHMRRMDGSEDRDGLLLDLVRELGKPLLMNARNEEFLYSGLLQKIAGAMDAIDEVNEIMQMVLSRISVPKRASAKYTYAQVLQVFTILSRARAGIKTQDHDNITPIREMLAWLKDQLGAAHQQLAKMSQLSGLFEMHQAQMLLGTGADLIQDMAIIRYPRSHRMQVHEDGNAPMDSSSVGMYRAAVYTWIHEYETIAKRRAENAS